MKNVKAIKSFLVFLLSGLIFLPICLVALDKKSSSNKFLQVLPIPEKISDIKGDVLALIVPQKEKFKKGIFWRIERQGVKPSFLLGTFHSPHPEVLALRKVISKQFKRSSVLCTEIKFDFSMMAVMQRAMNYPSGQTLRQTIGDKLYKLAVKHAKPHGLDKNVVNQMRPWAINIAVQYPKPNGKLILDMQLALDAADQSKPQCGLENAQEQLAALAAGKTDYHIRLLRSTLENYNSIASIIEKVHKIYLAGDLVKLANIYKDYPVPIKKQDLNHFIFYVVIRRNILMANRMQPHLKKGNAFFAVGALHLTGKGGILRLLEKQGYSLTRLH